MIQLTERERWLAVTGGLLLMVGFLYAFLIKPARTRTQRLYELLPQKQKILQQLELQGKQYLQLKDQIAKHHNAFPDIPTDGALLLYLETLLTRYGLDYAMNPEAPIQEGSFHIAVVQIHLENIPLKTLLTFLQDISTSPTPISVDFMQLNHPDEENGHLDAALTLHSPSRSKVIST